MRLRTTIKAPERFEDEDYDTPAASNATKPAFPRLLKEQTIFFDPHLPPAAFPSLKQANPQLEDDDRISHDVAEPISVDMMDIDRSPNHTVLPIVHRGAQLGLQTASLTSLRVAEDVPPFRRSFLDDAETSDGEEYEVSSPGAATPVKQVGSNQRVFPQIQHDHTEEAIADGAQSIYWTQLVPALQVEIFENLCGSRSAQAACDILGLGRDELHDVLKHLRTRDKQIYAEDQGIHQLQKAQLNAILRTDHSLRLDSDSWRGHVANTRRHLPHISPRFDYFICNATEVELARRFLKECSIDTCVLGKWARCGKDNGVTKWTQTQDVQAPKSREDRELGYTSEVVEQGTRHAKQALGKGASQDSLSDFSNDVGTNLSSSSSKRRRRPEPVRNGTEANATTHARGFGPFNGATTPTDLSSAKTSPDDQIATLAMSLRVRGSHLTKRYEDAMTLTKTQGGGLDESSIIYEDEDQRLEAQSPPRLNINPPKPPRHNEAPDTSNLDTSPGKRAITLKISPRRLQKVQEMKSSNTQPKIIRHYDILTPSAMTNTGKLINDAPKHTKSRPQQPMPALRQALKWQDQDKLGTFSLKLLEIQRGATGLHTPHALSQLPSQLSDPQTSSSPKRLKLNPPQDSNFSPSSDVTQMQALYGSSQPQRKDSASSNEAPAWSPITQRSNSFSKAPSRKASYKDDSQPYKLPSVDNSDAAIQFSPTDETGWIVRTAPAPQIPQHTKDPYLKPSIAENGSPVLALAFDNRMSSARFLDECLNQEARPNVHPGFSKSFEPPQTPRGLPSYSGIPSRESNIIVAGYADPLQIYGGGLFRGSPGPSQSSASKQLSKSLAGASFITPLSAKNLSNDSQPSISPAEQSKIEALLLSFQKKPPPVGEVPKPISATPAPVSKKTNLAEEEALMTGRRASDAEKSSEVIVAASVALQKPTQTKVGKDGKARPRTYTKSEKQIQKEATNAATKAGLGKGGVVKKKRIIEVHDTDAKDPLSLQTTNQDSPALQTTAHIRLPLSEDQLMDKIGPLVETQGSADPKKINFAEDPHNMEGGTIELPEVITPSKQKPSTSLNSNANEKAMKDAPGDESYEDDGASDTSISFKMVATPKGKKAALDWAKVAVEGYQQSIAMRGRSALTAMTTKMNSTPTAKTAEEEVPASRSRVTPKLNSVADHGQKAAPAAAKVSEFEGQDKPSVTKKATLEMKDASGNGEQSTPVRMKVSSLTKELSVLAVDDQGRTKAFRGNQYLNADRTPRLNEAGMPRRKKEYPTPGQ